MEPSWWIVVPSRSRAISRSAIQRPRSRRRGQDVKTQERPQCGRHDHRTVGLLVVLQDGHDPAGGAEGAVERRDVAGRIAGGLGVALTTVEAAGLVRRAVRGRRQLSITALGWHPRLAVELARGRTAEVAGGDVDDPVWHLDLGEHLLLPAEQSLMLSLRLLRPAVAVHLDLLELVHADDATSVLAV